MKIEYKQNSPSFQHIKLTRKESIKAAGLLEKYKTGKTDGILEQLSDIFTPYLEKEAKSKTHNGYLEKDFLQELHLKLFETFAKSEDNSHPITSIINKLNEMKPTPNESIARPEHVSLNELPKDYDTFHNANMLFSSETAKGRVKTLTNTSQLSQREKNILTKHLDGESFEEIAQKYWLTRTRIQQIYAGVIQQIKLIHNKKYRTELFENHPGARRFAEKRNLKFEPSPDGVKADDFDKIKIIRTRESETIPPKKIKIRPEQILVKSDIDSCNIIVYKMAKLKQDGIVTGTVRNHGRYDLTGLTGGHIRNYGEMNLHGIAEHRINNYGELNLTGTARENIVNKGELKVAGTVEGNIINSGKLEISGKVEGNVYTYNDQINIADGATISGQVYKIKK